MNRVRVHKEPGLFLGMSNLWSCSFETALDFRNLKEANCRNGI